MKTKSRLIAALLTQIMVVGLLPVSALAESGAHPTLYSSYHS